MPRIRIVRTVTLITEVPFNKDHYPDEETPHDAVKYERNLPREEKLGNFSEELNFANQKDLVLTEEITIVDRD